MAVLAVQQIDRTGVTPALAAAAAGGDSFPNSGKTYFHAKNAHASASRTLTFASQAPAAAIPQGASKADVQVVVPALTEKLVGPFDPAFWNDNNGRVVVTYSSEADLTVAARSV